MVDYRPPSGLLDFSGQSPEFYADLYSEPANNFSFLPLAKTESGRFRLGVPQFLLSAYEASLGDEGVGGVGADIGRSILGGEPVSGDRLFDSALRYGAEFMTPQSAASLAMRPSGSKLLASALDNPMVVMHNIHEVPLQKAHERGGIPVPSLAITKADEPLKGFGEVSLIGDPSMAKPSAKNPIYKTDAYTVRQPRTDVNPNKTAVDFAARNFTDPIKSVRYIDPTDVAEDLIKKDFNGYSEIPLKAAFLKEKGILPDLNNFENEYDFNRFVREASSKEYGYNNWFLKKSEELKSEGGSAEERIFMGFTPSGNRKYTSATLANLVKAMKNKGAGSEGMSGTPSSFRGKIAEKFKTEKELKESRGLLGKEESYEELMGEASESYYDILRNIENKTGLDHRGAEDVLEYMIIGGNRELRDFAKEYTDDFDYDLFKQSEDLAKIMRSLPTEYFEIKPQRGVSLGEFKGAIVPSNAEESTLNALKESGITNIKTYTTQEERAKLVKDFGDQFFTVPNVPNPASGLLGQEESNNRKIPAGLLDA